MSFMDPHSHTASIQVDVDAATALSFMADGMEQTHWALGSVDRRRVPDTDVFVGTSSFTGEDLYVRPVGDAQRLLVDYYVGPSPLRLTRLVEARIQPGEHVGRNPTRALSPSPYGGRESLRPSGSGNTGCGVPRCT